MLPSISLPISEQTMPRHGDRVWFWWDEETCNVATVAEVIYEPECPLRPRLNLSVLTSDTAKWVPQIGVPAVVVDGTAQTPKSKRWSLFD